MLFLKGGKGIFNLKQLGSKHDNKKHFQDSIHSSSSTKLSGITEL